MRPDNELVQFVWERGRVVPDFDAAEWRQDECGAWLQRSQFNNEASEFGWKILDVVADRNDDPDTLRPFHLLNSYDVEQSRPLSRVRADRRNVAAGTRVDQPHNIDETGRSVGSGEAATERSGE